MYKATSFLTDRRLSLVNASIDDRMIDEILDELHNSTLQIELIKLEKVFIEEIDFIDLLQALWKTQKNIIHIHLHNVNSLNSPRILFYLTQLLQSLGALELLDFSSSFISAPLFSIVLRTKIKRGDKLKLQFKGAKFSENCAEGLLYLKLHSDADLPFVLHESNVNAHRLSKACIGENISIPSPIKNAILNFSTTESTTTSKHLMAVCHCGRKIDPLELYFCSKCKVATCCYCACTLICGFTCYGCDRAASASRTPATFCGSCIQCPHCLSTLRPRENRSRKLVLNCLFCYWHWEGSEDDIKTQFSLIKDTLEKKTKGKVFIQQNSPINASECVLLNSIYEAIQNFEPNSNNINIFRLLPSRSLQNVNSLLTFKRLDPLFRRSCHKCSELLVQYDIQNEKRIAKSSSYYQDIFPVIDINSVQPPTLRIINFSDSTAKVVFESSSGCIIPKIEVEVEANPKAAINVNPLKVSTGAVLSTSVRTIALPSNLPSKFSCKFNDQELLFDFSFISRY